MKRLFPILLALALALSGCGGNETPSAPSPETPAPAAEPSAPEPPSAQPDKPEEWPLADDALVWEMVKIFGAEEVTGQDGVTKLVPTTPSLFSRAGGWTDPGQLSLHELYHWFLSTTFGEDQAYREEHYTHPTVEGRGWFFPQDLFEERVKARFRLDRTSLRREGEGYHPELGGYWIDDGGPGIGETPEITYTYRQREQMLDIDLTFTYPGGVTHGELRVRLLPKGGWHYTGWSFFPQDISPEGELLENLDLTPEQKELVARGQEIVSLFQMYPCDIDPSGGDGTGKEIGGVWYDRYTGSKYAGWADFRAAMLSTLTPEFFRVLNTSPVDGIPITLEDGGEFYYLKGARDPRPFYLGGQDRYIIRGDESDENRVVITQRAFYADENIPEEMKDKDKWELESLLPPAYEKTGTVILVNGPDGWRVAGMELLC